MPAPVSVIVVMMVMMPIMMMVVMVVPIVVMVMVMVVVMMMVMVMVMVVRQLHTFLRADSGVRLPLGVERRQNGDRIGNRLQQFSYAGGAQGLIRFL